MTISGWVGVDLDGTIAFYDGWRGESHIGEPIPAMMERVKKWLSDGVTVKIVTARASIPEQVTYVRAWLDKHGLQAVDITDRKDFAMVELWDDRAVQVIPNTGLRADSIVDRRGIRP